MVVYLAIAHPGKIQYGFEIRGMLLGMEYSKDQLTESAKNAATVSKRIGDTCADYIGDNSDRDPALVFGEVIAGIMAAAATIQAVTKRDPTEIALEFQVGVLYAGLSSPTEVLGERMREAVKTLAGLESATPNTKIAPGIN